MRQSGKVLWGLALLSACAPLAAQQLTDEQRSAIKSACRGDYQKVCASVPPGTRDSLQCLVQHGDQVSAGCQGALAPAASTAESTATASSAPATPAAAASAPAPAAAAGAGQPLSPRQEAHLLRAQCGEDFQELCAGVQIGGGRAVSCLRAHETELSPACRSALASASSH